MTTRGLQPITARNHVRTIERLERHHGALTRPKCDRIVGDLYASGASYSHKTNTVTAIEYYLHSKGHQVRYGRQKKPRPALVQVLTEGEVARMLEACRTLRDRAMLALLAYSGLRPKELCDVHVRQRDGQPYTAHALNRTIKRIAGRAGLTRRIRPYLLRHSLATNMIARGANVLHVRQQLRHVFLDTTYRYVSSLGYDPTATFDRLFPGYM